MLSRRERESRDLGRQARPVLAVRGAQRAPQRAPEHIQRTRGIPSTLVESRPREGEIRVIEHAVIVKALDPSPRASGRQRRQRPQRPGQHRGERLSVRMRGEDAERGVPRAGGGQPHREHLGPAPDPCRSLVPPQPFAEDIADDRAAVASYAESGEIRHQPVRLIAREDRKSGGLLEEARFQHGCAALRRQALESRGHPRREGLLLDQPDPVGRREAPAERARDRQEAGRLLVHERLEALAVEAQHAARHLGPDGGRPRLPGQQRHLAEEVSGTESVDPPRGAPVLLVHVDAQPSVGEDEEAVAWLALTADRRALLDVDGIEMGGQLGEREPVDLGEERDPGEGVLEVGLARRVGRHRAVTGSRPGEVVDQDRRSRAERVVLADHPRLEPTPRVDPDPYEVAKARMPEGGEPVLGLEARESERHQERSEEERAEHGVRERDQDVVIRAVRHAEGRARGAVAARARWPRRTTW